MVEDGLTVLGKDEPFGDEDSGRGRAGVGEGQRVDGRGR